MKQQKEKKFFWRARSAITGRFVSLAYARRHPRTTVVERVFRLIARSN